MSPSYHDNSLCAQSEYKDFLGEGETGLEVQGGRVTFKVPAPGGVRKGGGVRGRVKGMSDSSRRRLMAKFASLDYSLLASSGVRLWFITLTTPEVYWADELGVYKALRRFRDAMEYQQQGKGYLGAFVRRERGGKRGMLHYHMVVVGGAFCMGEVSVLWTRSLRSEVIVRVDVQHLDTAARVAKYLSKYCSKVGYEGKGSGEGPDIALPNGKQCSGPCASLSEAHNVGKQYTGGRWWYIWGESVLPWAIPFSIRGDEGKAIAKRFRRIFRRWRLSKIAESFDRSVGRVGFCLSQCSLRGLAKSDKYGEFLRRSSSGFTFFLSPDLLERMLDASALAVIGSPSRFPWEIPA